MNIILLKRLYDYVNENHEEFEVNLYPNKAFSTERHSLIRGNPDPSFLPTGGGNCYLLGHLVDILTDEEWDSYFYKGCSYGDIGALALDTHKISDDFKFIFSSQWSKDYKQALKRISYVLGHGLSPCNWSYS